MIQWGEVLGQVKGHNASFESISPSSADEVGKIGSGIFGGFLTKATELTRV